MPNVNLGGISLKTLDDINEALDAIADLLDEFSDPLQKIVDEVETLGKEVAQEKINELIDDLEEQVESKLKPIADKAKNTLIPQLEKAKEISEILEPIMDLLPIQPELSVECLTKIINAISSIFEITIGPYPQLIAMIAQIVPKIAEMNINIQRICSYRINVDVSGTDLIVRALNIVIPPIIEPTS